MSLLLLFVTPATPSPLLGNEGFLILSANCIGAVLTLDFAQGERPNHHLSHKLTNAQRRWPIVETETDAIYYDYALQELDPYPNGAKFNIKCDHKPFKYLLASEMKNRKVQMWAIAISGYSCQIEYIKGENNEQADMWSLLSWEECDEGMQPKEVDVFNSNRIVVRHSEHGQKTNVKLGGGIQARVSCQMWYKSERRFETGISEKDLREPADS